MLYRKCQLFCFENLKTANDAYSLVLMTYSNFPEADPILLPELLQFAFSKFLCSMALSSPVVGKKRVEIIKYGFFSSGI